MPMSEKDKEFQVRLLAAFKTEAEEHIKALIDGLISLEKGPPAERRAEIIETLYREAHSFKGAARAVNLTAPESICQGLEGVLALIKQGELRPAPEIFDSLYQAVDTIEKLLFSPEGVDIAKVTDKLSQLESGKLEKPEKAATQPAFEEQKPGKNEPTVRPHETIRVSLSKLNELFYQAEEMLSVKQATGQWVADLRGVTTMIGHLKKEWAGIYPEIRQLRNPAAARSVKDHFQSSGLSDFIERNFSNVKSIENRLLTLQNAAEHNHRTGGAMVDNILEDMKKALMSPFSVVLEILPKMIRDLSKDRGKEVRLILEGGEIEIDRRILEMMKDPLIHLIRNCIDHGIERPEARLQCHKPPEGTVTMRICRAGGDKVEVLVSDDGAGIDLGDIKKAAVKRGIIAENKVEKLTEENALSLIFQSGISTSPIITDISGRGFGLAIVKENVEKLGGLVSVETRPNAGTSFNIILPVTLATFRGILVRASDQLFMAPTLNMDRVIRVRQTEIKTVENRETILLSGNTIPLVRLDDVLEIPRKKTNGKAPPLAAMVVGVKDKLIACLVDEVICEQECLVKGLGRQLVRVKNIAGATVLGSGEVVPILNIQDLIKSAMKAAEAPAAADLSTEETEKAKKSIQVVEDSITSRMLLKNILESAGYHVETATDGMDAFASLKERDFDLVVSDIEMPRMNGFDLTSKIRSDAKLKDIPIVLVTALDSREDREHGIDVGADAYIVKSNFNQSNLLEVIRRLI